MNEEEEIQRREMSSIYKEIRMWMNFFSETRLHLIVWLMWFILFVRVSLRKLNYKKNDDDMLTSNTSMNKLEPS